MKRIIFISICFFLSVMDVQSQKVSLSSQLIEMWNAADREEQSGNIFKSFLIREDFVKRYRQNLLALQEEGGNIETLWVMQRFLANKYANQGFNDRDIMLTKQIVNEAIMQKSNLLADKLEDLGVSYSRLHTAEGSDSAANYYKLAINTYLLHDRTQNALETMNLLVGTLVISSKYHDAIDYILSHKDLLDNCKHNERKLYLNVVSWLSSAYRHLDYSIPGSREASILIEQDVAQQILNEKGAENVEYLTQLRILTLCYRVPQDEDIIRKIIKRMEVLWNSIPQKQYIPEYASFISSYYTFLCQFESDGPELDYVCKEMDELCLLPTTDFHTCLNYYINRSIEHYNKQQYEISLEFAKNAEIICKQNKEHPEIKERLAQVYTRLSETYFCLGKMADADENANLAFKIIADQKNYNLDMANMLSSLSFIKEDIGYFSEAKEAARISFQIKTMCIPESITPDDICFLSHFFYGDEKINMIDSIASVDMYNLPSSYLLYQEKGIAYNEMRDFEKADSLYLLALESIDKNKLTGYFDTPDRYIEGKRSIIFNQGQNYLANGDYDHAIQLFEQESDENNPIGILNSLYAYTGNELKFTKSSPLSFNKIKDEVNMHFLFLSEHEREMYMCSKIDDNLHALESSAVRFPNNPTVMQLAYNAVLLQKGLVLESVKHFGELSGNPNNFESFKELNELKRALPSIKSSDKRSIVQEKIATIEKQIIRNNQNYTSQLFIESNDIKNKLRNDEIAIEFFVYSKQNFAPIEEDRRLGALILSAIEERIIFVDVCRIQDLRNCKNKGVALYSEVGLNELYELLWKPLEPNIKKYSKVYFSPVDILHVMNIEVSAEEYNEDISFFRLSSTRNIIHSSSPAKEKKAYLFGDINYKSTNTPKTTITNKSTAFDYFHLINVDSLFRSGSYELPFSALEIYAIDSLMKKENLYPVIYKDNFATEGSFRALSGKDVSILHFSTHGFVNGRSSIPDYNDPLRRCGLLLSGAAEAIKNEEDLDENDGILLGEEIAALSILGNDIVVLSACETGLGSIDSEGVWGLQRAFKKAGANSILMSLWKVNDISSTLLMTEFYKLYLSGRGKQQSLLAAQKYIREYKDANGNCPFQDPYYWAAWILLDGFDK